MRTHCHFPHTHTQHVATPQTSRRGALLRQRRWITSATQIPPNLSPLWLKSFWNCHWIFWAASRVDCAVCSGMLPAVRCSICGKAWGDLPYSKCNNCGMRNADHHGVCCKKMQDAVENPPEEPPGAPEQLQSHGPHDWHVPPVPPGRLSSWSRMGHLSDLCRLCHIRTGSHRHAYRSLRVPWPRRIPRLCRLGRLSWCGRICRESRCFLLGCLAS